jgi:protein SCO1/2
MMQQSALPRWLRIGLAASVSVVVLAGALLLWLGRTAVGQAEFPVYAQMPRFALTNQAGKPVSSDQLKGKMLAVGFIYTNCTDICPMLTSQMKGLQDELRKEGLLGSDVVLLSISVDPERDTPDVLARYAADHHADLSTWDFLTGDPSAVRDLAERGFLVGMQKQPPTAPMNMQGDHDHAAPAASSYVVEHSGRIILVDRAGQLRAFYDGRDLDLAKVVADIQQLK